MNEPTTIEWGQVLIGTLGGGAFTTLVGKLFDWRLASKKQPLQDYQELVTTMRTEYASTLGALRARIEKLEADHEKCVEENRKIYRELGRLDERHGVKPLHGLDDGTAR